jgi:hypothetical protein
VFDDFGRKSSNLQKQIAGKERKSRHLQPSESGWPSWPAPCNSFGL